MKLNILCIAIVSAFILFVTITLAFCIVRTAEINEAKANRVYGITIEPVEGTCPSWPYCPSYVMRASNTPAP